MELIFKIVVGVLLLLFFTQCVRKKAAEPNLQNWLDGHFPGRFQVLSTQTDDAIRNLSFKVKKSVVVEAADTMVQSLVRWDLRQPDLKLTNEGVIAQFERPAGEWEDAQSFLKTLKKNGFENISISVRNGRAVVLVFEEPTPERRHKRILQLEKALAEWPVSSNYDKELAFMDTTASEKDFGDFVALAYWEQADVPYQKQKVISVFCPYNDTFSAAEMGQTWGFNTGSDRFHIFYKKVREELEKWTERHFKNELEPVFEMIEVRQSGEAPLLLIFKIPFVDKSAESNGSDDSHLGYFIIEFDVDGQEVKAIRQLDETPEEE